MPSQSMAPESGASIKTGAFMNHPLVIDYYNDILCVWAWIAQRRLDELNKQLAGQIEFRFHYMDVFGNVPKKMATQWRERGGYQGFAQHVNASAMVFEDASINDKIWTRVRPTTSANAHLILKAIELTHDQSTSINMALVYRTAFFKDALDISDLNVLKELAAANSLDVIDINKNLNNGTAMAALMADYQESKQSQLKGSPTYILDGGRQTLYGNVGYRVLLANIEELLRTPEKEASWC